MRRSAEAVALLRRCRRKSGRARSRRRNFRRPADMPAGVRASYEVLIDERRNDYPSARGWAQPPGFPAAVVITTRAHPARSRSDGSAALAAVGNLCEGVVTSDTVHLQDLPSIPVAVVQRRVRAFELPRVVPECCGIVWDVVRAQGARAGRNVAVYWDGTIRLEVGVEILGPFTEQDGVVHSATPAGTIASATHFGPYAGLGAVHDLIRAWCAAHGYRPAGPSWEIYGHWQPEWNTDPSLIRTDVCYQVHRATA